MANPRYAKILLCAAGVAMLQGCRAAPVRILDVPVRQVENPSLYLVCPKEKDAVRNSLVRAGFRIEESHLATPNFLRVTIGSAQGSRGCGALHNIRYELAIGGVLAIDLRRKGYTGNCETNVLDVLSAELYERLALPRGSKGEDT